MRYSFDTSAILDGWVRYYPPRVFTGLWTNIEALIAAGEVGATEEVFLELKKKEDSVHAWAKKHRGMFRSHDAQIQTAAAQILKAHRGLIRANGNRSGADPFVIGLAMIEKCTVVTGERHSGSLAKPKIPDVCIAMGVPCISFTDLFTEQGWEFVSR